MKLTLKWDYAEGDFDTKNVVLVAIKGQTVRGERCADIAIKDGMNFCIGSIHLGRTQLEDANALAGEIVRRFNEFPQVSSGALEVRKPIIRPKMSFWGLYGILKISL